MMFFFWGCFDLIVGVIDMRYDFDQMTYVWLISGIAFVIIGYITKKPQQAATLPETEIERIIREQNDWKEEWAKKEAWDGSIGHDPFCRAIPQNIHGIENSSGPCNCSLSRKKK